jgi:hypothetical protein
MTGKKILQLERANPSHQSKNILNPKTQKIAAVFFIMNQE